MISTADYSLEFRLFAEFRKSIEMIYVQHGVFGVCRLIDILVPDVPRNLDIKIKRERYLAKQALCDSDDIMKVRKPGHQEQERAIPGQASPLR